MMRLGGMSPEERAEVMARARRIETVDDLDGLAAESRERAEAFLATNFRREPRASQSA